MGSTANVVVLYGEIRTLSILKMLLQFSELEEIPTKTKIWIMTADMDLTSGNIDRNWDIGFLCGALSLASHSKEPLRFQEFLQTRKPSSGKGDGFIKDFWEQAFMCFFPTSGKDEQVEKTCTGEEKLEDLPAFVFEMSMATHSYIIYIAAYAVAHALQAMQSSQSKHRAREDGCRTTVPKGRLWQINMADRRGFLSLGDHYTAVCNTDMEDYSLCPQDQYPNDGQNKCMPKTITFLTYEEPLGFSLPIAAFSFSFITALVLGIFIKYHNTAIVKANNRDLTYTLLISLLLSFLCTLLFIGQPEKMTSCVPNEEVGWEEAGILHRILCTVWLATSPPFPDFDKHSMNKEIVLQCNEGSANMFYCVLGFMGFLAIVSFSVAFLARNLPDSFNEAKFITFSMLVFCSVWVSFVPTYLSTKGKHMAAVEIFSILASTAGLLICIFPPKCCIILLNPELNNREHLRRKNQ
ncbi:hypothetical protein EYD10_18386 [Varanus komodoensis]|nr:hypothetical protein EYD10_18386 [Varanus komodoensis]